MDIFKIRERVCPVFEENFHLTHDVPFVSKLLITYIGRYDGREQRCQPPVTTVLFAIEMQDSALPCQKTLAADIDADERPPIVRL